MITYKQASIASVLIISSIAIVVYAIRNAYQ